MKRKQQKRKSKTAKKATTAAVSVLAIVGSVAVGVATGNLLFFAAGAAAVALGVNLYRTEKKERKLKEKLNRKRAKRLDPTGGKRLQRYVETPVAERKEKFGKGGYNDPEGLDGVRLPGDSREK